MRLAPPGAAGAAMSRTEAVQKRMVYNMRPEGSQETGRAAEICRNSRFLDQDLEPRRNFGCLEA